VKTSDREKLAKQLEKRLTKFHEEQLALTGVIPVNNRWAFIEQVIDSVRRIEFVRKLREMEHSPQRLDGSNSMFDPLRGAVLKTREGDIEEAFWLVFLSTHCGKNLTTGWRLCGEIYGSLGQGQPWTWQRVAKNVGAFQSWLSQNHQLLQGRFGNHRKYESVKSGGKGTGAVVASYVSWIKAGGSHEERIANAVEQAKGNPKFAFAILYWEMHEVLRFGRIGCFDYLTMLAKLGLAPIEADSTYLIDNATGPARGARLLFDGQIDSSTSPKVLDEKLARLGTALKVDMQVLEDSVCNWQKSPDKYQLFRG